MIRQRLLENKQLDLQTAFDQANALDLAQKNSEAYKMPEMPATAAVSSPLTDEVVGAHALDSDSLAATLTSKKCYFCGDNLHNRRSCPARNSNCNNCGKKRHYARVCKSKAPAITTASMFTPILCSIVASCPESLKQATVRVSIGRIELIALIDSGSSESFISETMARKLSLELHPSTQKISMALTSFSTQILGYCFTDIVINQLSYSSIRLGVLKDLCSDIILGQDFQKKHERVTIEFGGTKPELVIRGPKVNLSPVDLGALAKKTRSLSIRKLQDSCLKELLSLPQHHGEHKLLFLKIPQTGTRRDSVLITLKPSINAQSWMRTPFLGLMT